MSENFREDITTTLERLSSTFATRDIMVKETQLVWADSESRASQLLLEYPSFDIIPIKQSGEFLYYLQRGAAFQSPILVENLISDSTPILELPGLFLLQDFYFVLSGKRIAGYIHFSDLNSQLVKIPYFVLLEAVESRIVERIDSRIKENDLDIVLPERSKAIKKKMKDLTEENADRGYINFMYFGEMLKFACYYHVLNLQDKDLKWVTDIRNRVDHADRPLIETKRDAIKLAKVRELCVDILDQLAN